MQVGAALRYSLGLPAPVAAFCFLLVAAAVAFALYLCTSAMAAVMVHTGAAWSTATPLGCEDGGRRK